MMARLREYAPQFVIVGILSLAIGTAAEMLGSDPVWLPQLFWAVGVVLVLSYAFLRPAELREALTGRRARYGGNTLIASIAFLGILGFINYLGAQYHHRIDMTETGQYSLSQQTKQILAGLEQPVQVTAFMSPGGPQAERVRNLLDEYKYLSDEVDYRFIDPDRQPAVARQYEISSYNVLVFEQGGRKQETFGLDEQDITSAILKVSETEPRKVYFTTGHQERGPDEAGGDGYSQVKAVLERDNYQIELVNLQTITDTVPSDAGAIIVAGPQVAFAPEEVQHLQDYVAAGGKLMVMADPGVETGLNPMLSQVGLRLDNDLIVDPAQSFFGDAGTPLVSNFQFHTITKDLGGLTVFFPLARSVSRAGETAEGVSVTEVARSSSRSWGETNLANLQQQSPQPDPDDPQGPLTMMAVATGPAGGRIAVVGDSDLVSNSILQQVRGSFGNTDLFKNTVNWLTESEELIAIGPKPPENRQIQPLTGGQQNLLLITFAGLLPLGILVVGGVVWWNRR
ncbi:MAG: hypothetical protein MAG451_02570 [Anaerolineales bacterium]|nr:hypothetical protein [Anaerolineales bacterium]